MDCPYCGNAMELGCIQNRDGVYWTKTRRAISTIVPPRGREAVSLNSGRVGYISGGSAEAWLCRACKKVVVDYAPKERDEE